MSGIDAAEGRPRGTVEGGCTLRTEGSVVGTPAVGKVGADAVDFGEPGAELDLSDSDSEPFASLLLPAPSLFRMFLMSMHVVRPLQAGCPASNPQHQLDIL